VKEKISQRVKNMHNRRIENEKGLLHKNTIGRNGTHPAYMPSPAE